MRFLAFYGIDLPLWRVLNGPNCSAGRWNVWQYFADSDDILPAPLVEFSASALKPLHQPKRLAFSLRALGRSDLPAGFVLSGRLYRKERTVKHDFFAATGFYEAVYPPSSASAGEPSPDRVVLKMGRTHEYAGIPMCWLGRFLCNREIRFYQRLADVDAVPAMLGRLGKTGLIHAFAPGRPLARYKPVPDGFFAELESLMQLLHRRGVAYVDTNKPENILLGSDNRPKLIDFQISWDLYDFGDNLLTRWLLRRLQREDLYHIRKHRRRMRPDELSDSQKAQAKQKSSLIHLHRWITRPYFLLRRRTFKRLRETGQLLPEGSK
jgi:hypothetical protein